MMRDGELRLRAAGFFDSADMYRELVDRMVSGRYGGDACVFDRGRIDHVGPMFGLPHGFLPSGMGQLNVAAVPCG